MADFPEPSADLSETSGATAISESTKETLKSWLRRLRNSKNAASSSGTEGAIGSDELDWVTPSSQFTGDSTAEVISGFTPEVDEDMKPYEILLYYIHHVFDGEPIQAGYKFTLSWEQVEGSRILSANLKREIIQIGLGYNTAPDLEDGLIQQPYRALDPVTKKSFFLQIHAAKKLTKITKRIPFQAFDMSLTSNIQLAMQIEPVMTPALQQRRLTQSALYKAGNLVVTFR